MTGQRGFTLIELMIVIGIIAIIAAIALPNLLSAKISANETAAITTLRTFSTSQAQFQSTAKADTDIDGHGAYGSILELSGTVDVRAGEPGAVAAIRPAILSGAFRVVNGNGEATRSGYFFKMYLPDVGGVGVCPDETGSFAALDEDLAETTWCCYAWPVNRNNSGSRVFFINQKGDVITAEDPGYTGSGNGPQPGAAFLAGGGPIDSITGLVANGDAGRDGNTWKQVQ